MPRHFDSIPASLEAMRRLAVTKQHLAGSTRRAPTSSTMLRLVRDLGCLQLDPINVVAPSHLIVLWSRLGQYDPAEFDALLWKDRTLFEYWGHQASIVLTEDYPLFYGMMRRDPGATPRDWRPNWLRKADRWVRLHSRLREYVLRELKVRGPLLSREFGHPTASKRKGSGWGAGADLTEMLQLLFLRGEVMVAGRVGRQRSWDLPERCLPSWVPRTPRSVEEVEYEAVQRSLTALGVASAPEIRYHFLRNRYPTLAQTLDRLVSEGKILRASSPGRRGEPQRYVHRTDVRLLESLGSDRWEPRTTLLSPFDNLLCDRARTESLFDARFRFEGYVPKAERRVGPYWLAVLDGARLIGRIDPLLDRKSATLRVNGVHPEPRAPRGPAVAARIREAVDDLARFLGADDTTFSGPVPSYWKSSLR